MTDKETAISLSVLCGPFSHSCFAYYKGPRKPAQTAAIPRARHGLRVSDRVGKLLFRPPVSMAIFRRLDFRRDAVVACLLGSDAEILRQAEGKPYRKRKSAAK